MKFPTWLSSLLTNEQARDQQSSDEATYLSEELFADFAVGDFIAEHWFEDRTFWRELKDEMVLALDASLRYRQIQRGAIKLVFSSGLGGPTSTVNDAYGLIVIPIGFLTRLSELSGRLMRCIPLATLMDVPPSAIVVGKEEIKAGKMADFPPIEDHPELAEKHSRLLLGAALTILFHELIHIRNGHVEAFSQLREIPDFIRTRRTLEWDADCGATWEMFRLFRSLDGPKAFRDSTTNEVERFRYAMLCISVAYMMTSPSDYKPLEWLTGTSIYPPAGVRFMTASGGAFANLSRNDPNYYDVAWEITEEAQATVFAANLAMNGMISAATEQYVWDTADAWGAFVDYAGERWALIRPVLDTHTWGTSVLSPPQFDPA